MARRGISGVAIGLIGTGVLLVRAAIRGTSPMDELRQLMTGQRPAPLSTEPRGEPFAGGSGDWGSGTFGGAKGSGKAHPTGKEAPHVVSEMNYISSTWGVNTYGWRAVGSVPGSDHPKGLAIDAMTMDRSVGNAIASFYIANASSRRVKYVIYYGRIWQASTGAWKAYFGPSPHRDHVHISFYPLGNPRAR